MSWSLEDRAAICLAASEGLGFGIAQEMVAAGARVLLVARRTDRLEEARAKIVARLEGAGAYPGIARWHPPEIHAADLLEEGAASRITDEAARLFGKIDILVNNIGGPRAGRFTALPVEAWEEGHRRLLGTLVRQVHAALPWLRKSDAARILTVTSISARQPIAGLALSNVFRAGLVGLAKTLAQELGPEGILVNNIAPGMFDTERLRELDEIAARDRKISLEDARRERLAQIPLGRFGKVEELGRFAVFLASPANSYITGQTILIDGGLYKGL